MSTTANRRLKHENVAKNGPKADFSRADSHSEKMSFYENAKKKLELAIEAEKKQKSPDAARISKMEQKLMDVEMGLHNLITNGR